MTKKILLKTNIKRDKEHLYFCGTSEDGYITVGSAEMARGRGKKSKK